MVCATFLTYLLNPLALTKLKATTLSSFLYLQPVVAVIFALIMGSDTLGIVKTTAAILIFTGVYILPGIP